jgi:hypothetical protein
MEGSLKLEGMRCYLAHACHAPIPHASPSCGNEEDEGESERASHREREREGGGKVAAAGDGRRGRSPEVPQSSARGRSECDGAYDGSGPYDEKNLQQYDEMHVHACTLLYMSSVREVPEARREEEARGGTDEGGGGGGASSRGTRAKNKALPLVRDVMCELVCSKWEVPLDTSRTVPCPPSPTVTPKLCPPKP